MNVIGYIRVIVLSGLFLPFAAFASDCDDIIKGEVDGRFYGWYGDTEVELEGGQVWQQVDGYRDNNYRSSRNPGVVIYYAGGGCKMLVAGADEAVRVERVEILN